VFNSTPHADLVPTLQDCTEHIDGLKCDEHDTFGTDAKSKALQKNLADCQRHLKSLHKYLTDAKNERTHEKQTVIRVYSSVDELIDVVSM
jgi:hypothetical protein